MPKFRRRPTEIEAVQWTGFNHDEVRRFIGDHGMVCDDIVEVTTLHGEKALVRRGDWIMPEPMAGRFYPCRADVFAATYDPVP